MITKKILHIEDDPTRRKNKGSSADENKALKALTRGGKRRGVIGPSMHVSKANPQGNRRAVAARPAGVTPRARWQHKKDFRGLGDYMLEGDKQPDGGREFPNGEGRVGTAFAVNTGVADNLAELSPEQVRETAEWMGSTAALNNRIVKSAVMHYVISVPIEDANKATPEFWRSVGPRVLEALAMEEHEALFVSHIETDNPHLHIMINRVHPVKETVVDPLRDLIRLEKLNRDLEKEFKLKVEPGRHIDPHTGATYDWAAVRRGEIQVPKNRPRMTRVDAEVFAHQVKKDMNDKPFSTAPGWAVLEERLAQYGYHLQGEGRGLKICSVDGREVKLTKIAGKGNGREKLEAKFGEKWADYLAVKTEADKLGVEVETVRIQRKVLDQEEQVDKIAARQAKADALKGNVASIWPVGPDTIRCGVEWGCESEFELRDLITSDVMLDKDLMALSLRTHTKNEEARAGMERTFNKSANALQSEGEIASYADWVDIERGTRAALIWLEAERKNRDLGLPIVTTAVVEKAPTKIEPLIEPFLLDLNAGQAARRDALKDLTLPNLKDTLKATRAALKEAKPTATTPSGAKNVRLLTEGLNAIKVEFGQRGVPVPVDPLAKAKGRSPFAY